MSHLKLINLKMKYLGSSFELEIPDLQIEKREFFWSYRRIRVWKNDPP